MVSVKRYVQAQKNKARQWVKQNILPAEFSFSASGEDQVALAWLRVVYGLDPKSIRYCDVGASHPKRLSNTFKLYRRGGSGVLVEPDPDMAALLRKHRPRDTVLNVGVAFDERRSAKLKRFSSRVFNTFSAQQAESVVSQSGAWAEGLQQSVIDEVEVPLVPLNDILENNFRDGVHFLSIDAEGVDFPILSSVDYSRFKPHIICVEASRALEDIEQVLRPHKYEFICRTPDNLLFRHNG